MGYAMAQASNTSAAQSLDRWPVSMTSSPQSYCPVRRSSLANSISTASSPESMISDSSRTSRSSSISSASSFGTAPSSTKLDVQARCRYAKQCSERYSLRAAIASVPEDYEMNGISSSPESYTGPVSKDLMDMSMETPMARRGCEADEAADAARVLQELHNYQHAHSQPSTGSKRSRPLSMDNALQENVREMLSQQYYAGAQREWLETTQCPRGTAAGGRKRVCYSADTSAPPSLPSLHPVMGGAGGVGMWGSLLN